jgi:hypothetical protein
MASYDGKSSFQIGSVPIPDVSFHPHMLAALLRMRNENPALFEPQHSQVSTFLFSFYPYRNC